MLVKIRKGSTHDQWEWNRETLILRHLQTAGPGGTLAHPTVLELYDSFIIKGPNGFHNCLVTEVVGRYDDFVHRRRYTCCPPGTVMEQVVAGVARLHQEGIAYGGEFKILVLFTLISSPVYPSFSALVSPR